MIVSPSVCENSVQAVPGDRSHLYGRSSKEIEAKFACTVSPARSKLREDLVARQRIANAQYQMPFALYSSLLIE